jgi:hypothetical protein
MRTLNDFGLFTPAMINIEDGQQALDVSIRHHQRLILDAKKEANEVWDRIEHHVYQQQGSDNKVVGLNERLRLMKYQAGDYFKPHYDQMYQRERNIVYSPFLLY